MVAGSVCAGAAGLGLHARQGEQRPRLPAAGVVAGQAAAPDPAAHATKVGGGAFGNRTQWIVDAIKRAIGLFREYPLDVVLLHYGHEDSSFVQALKRIS